MRAGQGPINVTVAANAGGDMVGAGIDSTTSNPGLYYFPPKQADYPNYIYMDSVNKDSTLTGPCNGGAGASGTGCVSSLADTVVAPNAVSGTSVQAGDMLVLVGDAFTGAINPTTGAGTPMVMRFLAAQIQHAKTAACTSGSAAACTGSGGGSQLITQGPVGQNVLTLHSGESPVSMDISPLDGSLFIATNMGSIYQVIPNSQITPGSTGYAAGVLYASNVPGIQKIRVGVNQGTLYLFATVQSGSANAIIEFVGTQNLPLTPTATAPLTSGTPAGLAVH